MQRETLVTDVIMEFYHLLNNVPQVHVYKNDNKIDVRWLAS